MKINTLLSHAAELFKLVVDSELPADHIASRYFRSKKYIGSGDRKFLSGLLFYTLRNLTFIEHLAVCLPTTFSADYQKSENTPSAVRKVVASYLLGSISEDPSFDPDSLLKRFYKQLDSFDELRIQTLSEIFGIGISEAENLPVEIAKSVDIIDSQLIDAEENEESFTDNQFLGLIERRYSLPLLLAEKLYKNQYFSFSRSDFKDLAASTSLPAEIFIRCNSRRDSRENIQRNLLKQGIETSIADFSPVALSLKSRTPLNQVVLYKKGLIEPQDEGSQIVSYALSPAPKTTVLDACAGAGGKTLHIAALQNDSGTVYACDTENIRLKEIPVRSKRYKYKSISSVLLTDKIIEKLSADKSTPFSSGFDYILIDAPCSGTGTIRRSPMQKFKIDEKVLKEFADLQLDILEIYSQFLKPGGVIVYATCSLMTEENDAVVERFMNNHTEFAPDSLKPVLAQHKISFPKLADDDFKLRLLPSIHGCDGFFMARLKKGK
ncbi:MAG: RsmB/NOP family class I SAM-dependent RNA methyltransferase [Chlorobi bacterium]|nr:RsmB/NOP family class I SAM-dependent RNA methyltransferase [Chlorobiota bacterium]